MIYTFLISIVFIAELIIAYTIIINLIRLDRFVNCLNNTILRCKNSIFEVCVLVRKISKQFIVLAEDFKDNVESKTEGFLLESLSKVMLSVLILRFNLKFLNKIFKLKSTKLLLKAFLMLENMI